MILYRTIEADQNAVAMTWSSWEITRMIGQSDIQQHRAAQTSQLFAVRITWSISAFAADNRNAINQHSWAAMHGKSASGRDQQRNCTTSKLTIATFVSLLIPLPHMQYSTLLELSNLLRLVSQTSDSLILSADQITNTNLLHMAARRLDQHKNNKIKITSLLNTNQ